VSAQLHFFFGVVSFPFFLLSNPIPKRHLQENIPPIKFYMSDVSPPPPRRNRLTSKITLQDFPHFPSTEVEIPPMIPVVSIAVRFTGENVFAHTPEQGFRSFPP